MPPVTVPTTSGTSSIKVCDANDQKGPVFGARAMCGVTPCIGGVSGRVTDCDVLTADPSTPLTSALVTIAPLLDSEVGDVILQTTLTAQSSP